jgi:hypothetical protein
MRRSDAIPLVVVYVIPVGVAAVLLTAVGLGILAVALLVVEVVVALTVVAARRTPDDGATDHRPSSRPWLIPVLLVGSLLVMAGVAVLASHVD